ncbi:MAG: VIT1/CCC1 transporter family protein [Gemmatimonadaceae bacterium]|nr:VIT1/CCC1 transporter family protein [Gemmatimonadaceae bacterium]
MSHIPMPSAPPGAHVEEHSQASEVVRDAVIGMSDGLTVPFALAAGLSGAVTASTLVVTAGIAEIVAGSIAMGLGGYLAARSEAEHYASELRREQREIVERHADEIAEVREIFETYGLEPEDSARLADALSKRPEAWVDFMMRFELGLEAPDPRRARTSALTIAAAYIVGGFVPLAPYMLVPTASAALIPSVGVTLAALAVFGYVKGRFTGAPAVRSAIQTVVIGGLAAGAAFGIARVIS